MATKSLKRKRVVLPMKAKLAILDKIAKGCTQRSLAEEYGVGKATVSDLKNNEAKIKDFASSLEDQGMSSNCKILCLAKDEQVEAALYLWFTQK
jgi:transcriptional regulator with XRE-family HTH domain